MFLHLGEEVVVPIKNVVAIIGMTAKQVSDSTANFLAVAEEEGFVVHLGEKPQSFVVTTEKVYMSPISVMTLGKRAKECQKRL